MNIDNLEYQNINQDFSLENNITLKYDDATNFLTTIPDNSIMLTITSPPYNIGKEYEENLTFEDYLSKQEEVIKELVRVTNEKGHICWEVGSFLKKGEKEVIPLDVYFYQIFKKYGLKLRNRIIWQFGHGLHASKRFSGRYETILWFSKSDDYTFNLDPVRVKAKYPGKRHYKGRNKGKPSGNPLGKNPTDFWEFLEEEWDKEIWKIPNVKSNHIEKTEHPCQYPVELAERCVLALTNPSDHILDPYCGAGSSLIAGIKHQRKVLGCDYNKYYINLSQERINKFLQGNLKIRPLGKPVYTPTGREKTSQIPKEWSH